MTKYPVAEKQLVSKLMAKIREKWGDGAVFTLKPTVGLTVKPPKPEILLCLKGHLFFFTLDRDEVLLHKADTDSLPITSVDQAMDLIHAWLGLPRGVEGA